MSTQFSLAADEVLATPGSTPLAQGVATELFSEEFSQGGTMQSASVYIDYKAFVPDTLQVSPFNFEILATLEQKQDDNSWEEIGRQNQPIRKTTQGARRQILVSPANAGLEEGVDQIISGFGGNPTRLKSMFNDEATGDLRVRIFALDNAPAGANPFQSVTVDVNVRRY